MISVKIWMKNKTPCIKLSNLQKQKSQGGLEAPNTELYYLSNQLKYLIKWFSCNLSGFKLNKHSAKPYFY